MVITDDTYHWLVGRCLELELQIAVLKGLETRLPAIERRDLYERAPPPVVKHPPRPIQRRATEDDIAHMRELKRRGFSNPQIGRRVGFSECTVRSYTKELRQTVES